MSRSFARAARLLSFAGFFVRSESPFFVPTRALLTSARVGAVKVGRRANLAACSAVARPHLDSFEHDGPLAAVGMTIRGSPLLCADQSRHNLVSGGSKNPNHDAVMRIGSEAPKRRTHSAFRRKPRKHVGTPPPRTVIGDRSQMYGPGRNCQGVFKQQPPFIAPGAERRRPALRPLARAATKRSEACAPRPRS